jgi:hypothetical protein
MLMALSGQGTTMVLMMHTRSLFVLYLWHYDPCRICKIWLWIYSIYSCIEI